VKSQSIRVSVIIPTYNREEVLINTIKSVLRQDFLGFELIVVDQSREHIKKTNMFLKKISDPRFRYFQVTPPSLPAARNFALTKAMGGVVLYIDDDVLLDKDFIKAHFEAHKKYKVKAIVGRIKERGKDPGELLFFRKTDFGAGNFNYPKLETAITAQGCNMSFDKKTLIEIGGFDTNYIGNALREESDVSFRLRKKGFETLYIPEASLTHLLTPTGGCREDQPTFENFIVFRNEFLFFLRHRPKVNFPYFFAGRFFKYAFNKDLFKKRLILKRMKIYFKGLLLGLWTYLFPNKQIIAKEISFK
jgi:GT2 family glycosyltransferase